MNVDQIDADAAAIVSGSDAPHDHYDSSSDEDEYPASGNNDNHEDQNADGAMPHHYNPNQDEEDEAYVYRHLRGGSEETVVIRKKCIQSDKRTPGTHGQTRTRAPSRSSPLEPPEPKVSKCDGVNGHNDDSGTCSTALPQSGEASKYITERARVLKPRHSDAVLSCPCCFQIVCMDCQRHERYANQFRAMFVMNIGVSWDKYIVPEETVQQRTQVAPNKSKIKNQERISSRDHLDYDSEDEHDDRVYYSVYCNHCMTEVAALDMKDEVYHFFGCVASG